MKNVNYPNVIARAAGGWTNLYFIIGSFWLMILLRFVELIFPAYSDTISNIIGTVLISGGVFGLYRILVCLIKKTFRLKIDEFVINDAPASPKIFVKRSHEIFISICCWAGAAIIAAERALSINRVAVITSVSAIIIICGSFVMFRVIAYLIAQYASPPT